MLSLALIVVAAAAAPDSAISRVQQTYQRGDLCAAFEQTYVEKLRNKKKVESGRLWAKRDGRVRWTYEKPTRKDFVYDGKKAWFYEPDNGQVTEFDKFEQSPIWGAVRFLWGQGNLMDVFAVAACNDPKCRDNAAPGLAVYQLTPKKPIAAVDHVVLEVDPATSQVRRSIVYDTLGNRTEYAFSDVSIGCQVPDAKLTFEVPKGVSVVRASGDPVR
jgi:outer membrane lipoprotein carrier protein